MRYREPSVLVLAFAAGIVLSSCSCDSSEGEGSNDKPLAVDGGKAGAASDDQTPTGVGGRPADDSDDDGPDSLGGGGASSQPSDSTDASVPNGGATTEDDDASGPVSGGAGADASTTVPDVPEDPPVAGDDPGPPRDVEPGRRGLLYRGPEGRNYYLDLASSELLALDTGYTAPKFSMDRRSATLLSDNELLFLRAPAQGELQQIRLEPAGTEPLDVGDFGVSESGLAAWCECPGAVLRRYHVADTGVVTQSDLEAPIGPFFVRAGTADLASVLLSYGIFANTQIYWLPNGTTEWTELTNGPGTVPETYLFRDGKRAIVEHQTTEEALVFATWDGSQVTTRRLDDIDLRPGFANGFAVSTDESRVAFGANGALYGMALGGAEPTEPVQLSGDVAGPIEPNFAFSPNGRHLVYLAPGITPSRVDLHWVDWSNPDPLASVLIVDVDDGDVESFVVHDHGVEFDTFTGPRYVAFEGMARGQLQDLRDFGIAEWFLERISLLENGQYAWCLQGRKVAPYDKRLAIATVTDGVVGVPEPFVGGQHVAVVPAPGLGLNVWQVQRIPSHSYNALFLALGSEGPTLSYEIRLSPHLLGSYPSASLDSLGYAQIAGSRASFGLADGTLLPYEPDNFETFLGFMF